MVFDNLNETKLQEFYNFFISKQQEPTNDFWDLLSDWEKEDINAGIDDLDKGRYRTVSQKISKQ